MDGLVLVLWPGIRARAYLQCVLGSGRFPAATILIGDADADRSETGWGKPPRTAFDPGLSLRDTLAAHDVPHVCVPGLDLGDPALATAVREAAPRWAVFSGGGIVPRELLAAAPRWIHVHPGRLPDWRGSTCLYYGLLLEERVAATAFFLEEDLDRGQMLAHRHFDPDPRWSPASLDHAADAWMRAEVLSDALDQLELCPGLQGESQDPQAGQMFYVVHPVLKHMALQCAGIVKEEEVPAFELRREDEPCRS